MKWAIVAAIAIGVFGFIPGMGIPGALAIGIGSIIISPFYELKILGSQVAWPAAILATWIFPVFIPIGFYLAYRKLKDKRTWIKHLTFLLVLYIGSVLVTVGIEGFHLWEMKNAARYTQPPLLP